MDADGGAGADIGYGVWIRVGQVDYERGWGRSGALGIATRIRVREGAAGSRWGVGGGMVEG